MEWNSSFYPKVKELLLSDLPDYWPDFEAIAYSYLDEGSFPIEVMLTFCSCKAVNGIPENALEVCAGLMFMNINFRILNEIQNEEKPCSLHNKVGKERALNYANAFKDIGYKMLGKASLTREVHNEISKIFFEGSMISLAGNDRELLEINKAWNDYWNTAEMKTCFISSATAGIGAILGTNQPELIQVCQSYGYHWGLAKNIMTEVSEFWGEKPNNEAEQGKINLPLLYGICCQHPEREDLIRIVRNNQISRLHEQVKTILDNIDAQNYLISAALEQREKAIDCIGICPNKDGKDALEYYLNMIFGDVNKLLKMPPPKHFPIAGEGSDDHITLNYKSVGLKLRQLVTKY